MANQYVGVDPSGLSITCNAGAGWASSSAGSTILVALFAQAVPTVSDNLTQTYSLVETAGVQGAGDLYLYRVENSSAGVTSITASSAAGCAGIFIEAQGIATSSSLDDSNGALVPSAVTAWSGGNVPSITTTNATDDLFAFLCTGDGSYYNQWTANSPWTALSGTGLNTGGVVTSQGYGLVGHRRTTSSTGSYAPDATASLGIKGGAVILALKQAGGGGGATLRKGSLLMLGAGR
jgi:hypothetical protein